MENLYDLGVSMFVLVGARSHNSSIKTKKASETNYQQWFQISIKTLKP